MRSWLAQSLRALEDMLDSGELTEEELKALARSPLMPSMSTLPPAFEASANIEDWYGTAADARDEDPPDETGVHAAQPSSHRSGTMPQVDAHDAIAKRTGTKK